MMTNSNVTQYILGLLHSGTKDVYVPPAAWASMTKSQADLCVSTACAKDADIWVND